MELTPLRYFVAIAKAGHLTSAARSLGVTQPALSAMLKKLEAEVGAALLHRTGRGVELTQEGRAFLGHAQATLAHAQAGVDAVRQMTGLEAGSVRIGGGATAMNFLLPGAISQIRRKHPALSFHIREAGSNQIAQGVLDGDLDLGIVTLPITIDGADRLLRVPLLEDELRMIAPQGHALAGKRSFAWKDVAGEAVVGFEAGSAVRQMIDREAARAQVALRYVMELRSIEGIVQMVRAGVGVGFVSRFGLREGEGGVCRDGPLKRSLAIVRRRDRNAGPGAAMCERVLLAGARKLG